MNEPLLPDPAMLAAELLDAEFAIGTFSRFCDEPPTFDHAELEEIARIIRIAYQDHVEASNSPSK